MNRLLEVLKGFKGVKVAVIGDLIADEYILGYTSRISREAPVLVLKYDSRLLTLGGAGNALNNIKELGGNVYPFAAVGDDPRGREIIELIKKRGVETEGIIIDPQRITPLKTRILAGGKNTTKQQVIRIDREVFQKLNEKGEKRMLELLKEKIDAVDALLISDYSLGMLNPEIIKFINKISSRGEKIVTVDSRYNLLKFKNVNVATPNTEELEWLFNLKLKKQDIQENCRKLRSLIKSEAILLTQGREGMSLLEKNGDFTHLEIYGTREVADVTGAGDTVISVFTLALCAGATMKEATKLANYAGGIVVAKRGTAPVTYTELEEILIEKKSP